MTDRIRYAVIEVKAPLDWLTDEGNGPEADGWRALQESLEGLLRWWPETDLTGKVIEWREEAQQ